MLVIGGGFPAKSRPPNPAVFVFEKQTQFLCLNNTHMFFVAFGVVFYVFFWQCVCLGLAVFGLCLVLCFLVSRFLFVLGSDLHLFSPSSSSSLLYHLSLLPLLSSPRRWGLWPLRAMTMDCCCSCTFVGWRCVMVWYDLLCWSFIKFCLCVLWYCINLEYHLENFR